MLVTGINVGVAGELVQLVQLVQQGCKACTDFGFVRNQQLYYQPSC